MPISFKTGNRYNFKPENIRLRQGETPKTLKTLNRIELRYNTRTTDPSYPQFKSLYKWRSVFGYRLGGVIRQGIVKLTEVKRHFENAVNLHAAAKGMRKEIKGSEGELTLADYTRLYSTRDIISAMKKDGVPTEMLKYVKYMTYDTFSEGLHGKVAESDFSVRKLVVDTINDGRVKRHEKAVTERETMSEHNLQGFIGERQTAYEITPGLQKEQDRIDAINGGRKGAGNLNRFVRGALSLDKLESALATVKVKFDLRARWDNAKFELGVFRDDRKEEIQYLRQFKGTEKQIASLERRTGFTELVKGFFEKREVKQSPTVKPEEIQKNQKTRTEKEIERLELGSPLEDSTDPNMSLKDQLEKVRFGFKGDKTAL
jgi:hypothetical protein